MIKELTITNFKLHKNTLLKLSNLTVLCGANSVGKTSAVQPLLLLRDTFLKKSGFTYMDLLSDSVKIGSIEDAVYQYAETDDVGFNLLTDGFEGVFKFTIEDKNYTKTFMNEPKGHSNFSLNQLNLINLERESLFNSSFQYISSARLGSQPSFPKDDVVVEKNGQISVIEGKAEYCVHYLFKNQNRKVLPALLNDRSNHDDLILQVSAWEKEISEGIAVNIIDNGKLGFELKYQYDTSVGTKRTNEYSSVNVGYGVTYVLPILVAILSAQPGALIIIENPEAHLHPNGIAKLMELICKAAQAGIQIIIETHSDHVINGILVQSKQHEESDGLNGIDRENVSIYQFERDEKEHCSIAIPIKIEEDGRIRYAPKGFFDQFSIDRKYLMGF